VYRAFFKRFFDFFLSLFAPIVLSPILLILIALGAVTMKGNPFFVQHAPAKKPDFRFISDAPFNPNCNQFKKLIIFLKKHLIFCFVVV